MYQFTTFSLFSDSSWVGKTIELPSGVFLFEGPLDTYASKKENLNLGPSLFF